MMYLNLALLFLCILVIDTAIDNPIVETQFGPVLGKWMKTNWNLPVAAFLGIPYAEPPVGSLRFKSPQPWTRNWNKIRDATDDGSRCPQMNRGMIVYGDEDCLFLNIFVPENKGQEKIPVMVYVHGGAYFLGSNNSTMYPPTYLLNQKIILVTVNYRLGILGFLSSGNQASPGNYGLKDVVQALKWIQENIEVFGGDPSSVTLFGHSAGASLVHHLALSKRTEGLFDKLITQSGSANAPWGIHSSQAAKIRYITLAIQLGCATDRKIIDVDSLVDEHEDGSIIEDDMKILDCLREKSPREITEKIFFFVLWGENPIVNFGPTVEPESEDAMVTQHPMSTIEKGEFRDIPWITGVVADEGLLKSWEYITDLNMLETVINKFPQIGTWLLETEEIVENSTIFNSALLEQYLPDGYDENNILSVKSNLIQLMGDGLITYWSFDALNAQSKKKNSSTFFYEFAYVASHSGVIRQEGALYSGVGHGDELAFLFGSFNNPYNDQPIYPSSNDETMINIMAEFWTSFAKTGIPSAHLTSEWQPYGVDFRFMQLGMGSSPDISMKKDFLPIRMEFWRELMDYVVLPRDVLFPEMHKEEAASTKEATQVVENIAQLNSFNIQLLPLFLAIPLLVQ